MARQIVVDKYNPEWVGQYQKAEACIKSILGDKAAEIHHIGSTAVPGLSAKPTIDVMVITPCIEAIDEFNEAMQQNGFSPFGEYHIPGRRYFVKTLPDNKDVHTHHVHIYQPEHPQVQHQLLFKRYLIEHPEALLAYQNLKDELAVIYRDNPAAYTEAKTDLITEIMSKARKEYL